MDSNQIPRFSSRLSFVFMSCVHSSFQKLYDRGVSGFTSKRNGQHIFLSHLQRRIADAPLFIIFIDCCSIGLSFLKNREECWSARLHARRHCPMHDRRVVFFPALPDCKREVFRWNKKIEHCRFIRFTIAIQIIVLYGKVLPSCFYLNIGGCTANFLFDVCS